MIFRLIMTIRDYYARDFFRQEKFRSCVIKMVSLIFMQFKSKIKNILDSFLFLLTINYWSNFLTRYFKCTFLSVITYLHLLKYREKLSGKLLQILRYK